MHTMTPQRGAKNKEMKKGLLILGIICGLMLTARAQQVVVEQNLDEPLRVPYHLQ